MLVILSECSESNLGEANDYTTCHPERSLQGRERRVFCHPSTPHGVPFDSAQGRPAQDDKLRRSKMVKAIQNPATS